MCEKQFEDFLVRKDCFECCMCVFMDEPLRLDGAVPVTGRGNDR